jgi:hypothetical protein
MVVPIFLFEFTFFINMRDLLRSRPSKYIDKKDNTKKIEGANNLALKKRKDINRTYNMASPNDYYQNHLIVQGEYNPTK